MPEVLRRQSGFTLVILVLTGFVLSAVSFVLLDTSERARKHVNKDLEIQNLAHLGDSLITLTVDQMWEGFIASLGGAPNTPLSVRAYFDLVGVTASVAPAVVAPPVTSSDYQTALDPSGSITLTETSLLLAGMPAQLGLGTNAAGQPIFGGARILDLNASRQDIPGGLLLTITARLTNSGVIDATRSKLVRKSFALEMEPFIGWEFGLLANNINCSTCHAHFDRADRYYNRDSSLYGTFPQAKVGALESIKIRTGSADSTIAGTLYARGAIMDKSGSPLASLAGTSLTGFKLDAQGNLVQDAQGNMISAPLGVVDESGVAIGSGSLPGSFPSVVPDENNNKIVDQAEFTALAQAANGNLLGGIQNSYGAGVAFPGGGLPATSNMAGITGSLTGNTILIGTPSAPLELSGNVTIDGDLIIAGVVKGSGSIIASGNVYVVGSLTYADGVELDPLTGQPYRTFGVAADGTINELSLAAGGNLLVGDYLSAEGGVGAVSGLDTGNFNFTLSETTLFNRMEWTRTQPTLPGPNLTTINNPLYQPGYLPRYYTYNAGDPVYIYLDPANHYFDPVSKTWAGKEHMGDWAAGQYMTIAPGDAAYAAAAIVPLNPAEAWISSPDMLALMQIYENANLGEAFRVDAMMYTNNSIMSLARSSSTYQGQLFINGGIVAADVGILAAGDKNAGIPVGLQLNYDSRLTNAFNIQGSDSTVSIRRIISH